MVGCETMQKGFMSMALSVVEYRYEAEATGIEAAEAATRVMKTGLGQEDFAVVAGNAYRTVRHSCIAWESCG